MFEGLLDFVGIGENARAFIIVQWHVLEGGFHFHVERCARETGVKGWMRVIQKPMYDYIEMEVEGSKYKIDKLIERLKQGHKNSKVSGLDISWKTYKKIYSNFQLRI